MTIVDGFIQFSDKLFKHKETVHTWFSYFRAFAFTKNGVHYEGM
jgi:hypothetical protein